MRLLPLLVIILLLGLTLDLNSSAEANSILQIRNNFIEVHLDDVGLKFYFRGFQMLVLRNPFLNEEHELKFIESDLRSFDGRRWVQFNPTLLEYNPSMQACLWLNFSWIRNSEINITLVAERGKPYIQFLINTCHPAKLYLSSPEMKETKILENEVWFKVNNLWSGVYINSIDSFDVSEVGKRIELNISPGIGSIVYYILDESNFNNRDMWISQSFILHKIRITQISRKTYFNDSGCEWLVEVSNVFLNECESNSCSMIIIPPKVLIKDLIPYEITIHGKMLTAVEFIGNEKTFTLISMENPKALLTNAYLVGDSLVHCYRIINENEISYQNITLKVDLPSNFSSSNVWLDGSPTQAIIDGMGNHLEVTLINLPRTNLRFLHIRTDIDTIRVKIDVRSFLGKPLSGKITLQNIYFPKLRMSSSVVNGTVTINYIPKGYYHVVFRTGYLKLYEGVLKIDGDKTINVNEFYGYNALTFLAIIILLVMIFENRLPKN